MTGGGEIDEFQLVRPLGRGGMGEVYLGHDTVLDRAVAIKLIGSRSPDASSRERFLIEARAIARLSHPNVVTIFRVGTTADGRPFLVQELIRGKSLDQVARPVAWREVCELAIGIARGLDAAHRRGILHRDVKPANVMLDEHGTARLLDFGLAKLTEVTEPGMTVGEPAGSGVAATLKLGKGSVDPIGVAETRALSGPRTEGEGAEKRAPSGSRTDGDVVETREPSGPRTDGGGAGTRANGDAVETRGPSGPRTEGEGAEKRASGDPADLRSAAAVVETRANGDAVETRGPSGSRTEGDAAETRGTSGSRTEGDAAETRASSEARGLAEGRPAAGTPARADAGHTEPGSLIGTPRYTAPELWRGEPASVRSDLYSLGVLLYELLAGVPPYPETEITELAAAVLAGGARPVGELAADVHADLARIVMRCLAAAAADRPSTAAELVHELEGVIAGAPAVPGGNPYRGLRAFDAEHRGLFFGRGSDVGVLVDRLRGEPLVIVVGDSGIGKSSVCHAGVVPAVLAGGLSDRRTWRAVTVVPGRAPWTALREALGIAADDRPASELVRGLRPADGAGVLIVVDQLEELVTLGAPAEAARVAEVLAAIADGVPGVKALLAVRGDFLTRVAALPELGGVMARGLHLLRVLAAADLREAVVGPARATGVRFESDAMVDALVDAVAGNAGALPLLQFTLAELWQARDRERGVIPASALDRVGGVDGGLAGHADAVLFALGEAERAAARRIVLRLVSAAGTRAVRDRGELVGDDAGAANALESLVRGRLVVARDTIAGTPSYELAHEALIRGWGTLRDWLDAAAGQRAVRDRLTASAAEWQRLDRRPDLLWRGPQLDEARGLAELHAGEQAFVAASRRQVRRRRLARIAAIAAVPVVVLAIWLGVRFDAARQRDAAVAERVEVATRLEGTAAAAAIAAAGARGQAFTRFDAGADADGEVAWAEARRLAHDAQRDYRAAVAELEAAQLVGGGVSERMAALLWSLAELAEAEHDRERVDEHVHRLATYDPARAQRWHAPAHLAVAVDRAVRIALHANRTGPGQTIAGGFDAVPVESSTGDRLDVVVAPGSYVVVATLSDGTVVREPVLLRRGERLERSIVVPAGRVPAGLVYIPPGRFLYGSDRDDGFRRTFLSAQPLHAVETGGYAIGKTEVTIGEWIDFLRVLPVAEREARRPQTPGGSVMLIQLTEQDGRFSLAMQPTTVPYRATEGAPIIYPERTVRRSVRWERLPVAGISWEDALAYTAWLDRSGRVPGARPCTIREWERAARGADGQSYPHGEVLEPADANYDLTYGRKPLAFGPDEVGSYPRSDSPFGVSDLAGNVWEWVRGDHDVPSTKGGSWYQGAVTALSSNRNVGVATQRELRLGMRVCADVR